MVRKTLHQRYISFIGDGTVRHLFDALCRALGDTTTDDTNGDSNSGGDGLSGDGDGDGTTMGSDRLEWYRYDDGSTIILQYCYAPLPGDIATFLGEMRKRRSLDINNICGADMIVAGCGMLDTLHISSSIDGGEEGVSSSTKRAVEETYLCAVCNLATKFLLIQQPLQRPRQQQDGVLHSSATSTIWMTPTTINTQALLNGGSIERRRYMDERTVEKTRTLYRDLGIYDAVRFVLDGKMLTEDLIHESWDGVLYPKVVYDVGIQIVLNALD